MSDKAKKALIIGHSWPEPKTTAAGQHMMQLLEAFQSFEYEITLASTAAKTEYSANLDEVGVNEMAIRLNHASFDQFVTELSPDIVIFDRFMVEEQFGWRVAEFVPQALRILNTEDLHSLRSARKDCHSQGESFNNEKWLDSDMVKREVASIYRSDLSLLVSTHEIKLLRQQLNIPKRLLFHLPFLLDNLTEKTIEEWPAFRERSDFICFGNGKHDPNVDSIVYLKEEIWPLIRNELPTAELHIFGAYLPKQVWQMHNPEEGFLVQGWAANLGEELQKAKVKLAPLRFGAGIKGKLVDAMRNGTPSVTTPIGAEGMHDDLPWPGEIADNAINFAKKAVHLYQNEQEWGQKQRTGVEVVNQIYSKEKRSKKFKNRLENLKSDLKIHRKRNFIGGMIQHQTMAATKYMGKWIEEKNGKLPKS